MVLRTLSQARAWRPAVVARLARTLGGAIEAQPLFRSKLNTMHHKRRRAKSCRSGCLMCKPNKMNGWPSLELGHTGFGKLRREINAVIDLREQRIIKT